MPIRCRQGLCRRFASADGVEIVGLHIHLGSQITDLEPLRTASEAIVALAGELRDVGRASSITSISAAASASRTTDRAVPSAQEYADALLPAVRTPG